MPQRTCCHACSGLLGGFYRAFLLHVVQIALQYPERNDTSITSPRCAVSCSVKRMRHITDVAELARFPSDNTFSLYMCASCQQQAVPCLL